MPGRVYSMDKKIITVLILIVSVIGILFLPNDKKKILSNMDTLAEYCSSTSEETAIALLKKAALAAKLCKNPCMVQIDSHNIHRDFLKKELTDQILMMKRTMPETSFSFYNTNIIFPQKTLAEITTTLQLTEITSNDRFSDTYELTIHAEKTDGDWLFSFFSVIEFMRQ